MSNIAPMTFGLPQHAMDKFNEMADQLNALTSPVSNNGSVRRSRTGAGAVSTLATNLVNPKIPIRNQSIPLRRARTTQDAPGGLTITCNLYDFNGVEQTTGDESGITVYCSIAGGNDLDEAVARLEEDLDVVVAHLPFSSTEYRWYMVGSPFQASEDCS